MGLEFKLIQSEKKELSGATCDRCNKKIEISGPGHWNDSGEPYSLYHEPYLKEECFILHTRWGYYSNKDMQEHTAVLCEACYDIVFKDVKIKIEGYDFG